MDNGEIANVSTMKNFHPGSSLKCLDQQVSYTYFPRYYNYLNANSKCIWH